MIYISSIIEIILSISAVIVILVTNCLEVKRTKAEKIVRLRWKGIMTFAVGSGIISAYQFIRLWYINHMTLNLSILMLPLVVYAVALVSLAIKHFILTRRVTFGILLIIAAIICTILFFVLAFRDASTIIFGSSILFNAIAMLILFVSALKEKQNSYET